MAPQHLISPATLPTSPFHLSVLTYNVLLPNSQDGWWNYKMYSPTLPHHHHHQTQSQSEDITTWTYRRKLLQEKLRTINPDVVCLQEVSPLSFESDFTFMREELGYDGVELFKRGRFRPATFWRTDKCELVDGVARHCDRTLLTPFRLKGGVGGDGNLEAREREREKEALERNWHVLNCHLQAGPQGKRRVRQIDDGVKASFKMAKKLKEKDPTNPLLIICGDFNGGHESGAVRYLEDGQVGPEHVEDGEPVSSKPKKSPLSHPMIDVSSTYLSEERKVAPPTLVVSELISLMVEEGTEAYGEPVLSKDVVERLERVYYSTFATHGREDGDGNGDGKKVMNCDDVERWSWNGPCYVCRRVIQKAMTAFSFVYLHK